MLYVPLIY